MWSRFALAAAMGLGMASEAGAGAWASPSGFLHGRSILRRQVLRSSRRSLGATRALLRPKSRPPGVASKMPLPPRWLTRLKTRARNTNSSLVV